MSLPLYQILGVHAIFFVFSLVSQYFSLLWSVGSLNSYLKYGGFRELIALAKKIDNTPKSVHIVFDDEETSEQVTKLTAAMSSYSSQLRRIGTNLSSLIADIRDKKVALNNDDILSALESLEKSVKVLQLGYSKTAKEARDVFHSDKGITKTEYIERK